MSRDKVSMMNAHLDKFISEPDVRERFETTIKAPATLVMESAYHFDLQSIGLIRAIIGIRKLLLGGTSEKRKKMGLVEESRKLGWGTLVEVPDRLLVCGAVCQPWIGDVVFNPIPLFEFARYAEPDQVKIVWSLETEELGSDVTLFSHEVRAQATDDQSRNKFKRYWRWARFGIIAIRLLLIPAIRRDAEKKWRRQQQGL